MDLTQQSHNLLENTEIAEGVASTQDHIWDSNPVFMTEGESAHTYLQDELGSTVRMVGMQENQQTVYGYCCDNPMVLVDPDGKMRLVMMFYWFLILFIMEK